MHRKFSSSFSPHFSLRKANQSRARISDIAKTSYSCFRLQKRPYSWRGSKQDENSFFSDEFQIEVKKKLILFRAAMIKKKRVDLPHKFSTILFGQHKQVYVPPFSWSEVAGHGSFIFLAMSYLESDFLSLRMYAVSGITLSVIFQYYREFPLWIPIRWNSIFLLINGVMIALLLKEESEAKNLTEEEMDIYNSLFRVKGMKLVDFRRLISQGKRIEFKRGDKVVDESVKNTRLFLVQKGALSIYKGEEKVGSINRSQFVGAMSFLSWQNKRSKEKNEGNNVDERHWVSNPLRDNPFNFFANDNQPTQVATVDSKPAANRQGHLLSLENESDEGVQGQATVICEEDCVAFCWKFRVLDDVIEQKPVLGLFLERCISEDLNKKMSNAWAGEMKQRYHKQLQIATIDGEIGKEERKALEEFRQTNKIEINDHEDMLNRLGWTADEFAKGRRAKASNEDSKLELYVKMLESEIDKGLTEERRTVLRNYRIANKISSDCHLQALKQVDWSLDDYEAGEKISLMSDAATADADSEQKPSNDSSRVLVSNSIPDTRRNFTFQPPLLTWFLRQWQRSSDHKKG